MNLINKSSSPQYCGMARTTVKPGRSSTTLDVVQKFVDKLFSDSRGFQIHLSDGDLNALSRLVEAHLRSENSEKTASVLEIHREESYSERLSRLLRNEAYRKQKRFEDAVKFLEGMRVLPSENSNDAHALWQEAWAGMARQALAAGDAAKADAALVRRAEYPENLGRGKPYPKDE